MTDKDKRIAELEEALRKARQIYWDDEADDIAHEMFHVCDAAINASLLSDSKAGERVMLPCPFCGDPPNEMHTHNQKHLPKIYWCECDGYSTQADEDDADYRTAQEWNDPDWRTPPQAHGDVERGPWKCFHCGETFTERHCAFEHFGADERRDPACIVAARPGGLLEAYRQAESDALRYQSAMHEESADAIRAMMGMEGRIAKVVRDAEEQGYARGLEDARAEAVSAWGDGAVDSVKAAIDATLVIVSEGPQDDGIANLEDVARAALSAMRPAIDQEKIAEIKRAYEAWRAADTRCALLADPEDEGSPSDRQDAAEEAAWAWDQAASKFMWNADALLAMIGGGDE